MITAYFEKLNIYKNHMGITHESVFFGEMAT